MSKFKLMNAKELAEFILSKGMDEEYSFATIFPGKIADEDLDEYEHDIATWYGIKKIRYFDSDVVAVGHYGGGFDGKVFDIDNSYEYLEGDLEQYLTGDICDGTTIKGVVCVDLRSLSEREENAITSENPTKASVESACECECPVCTDTDYVLSVKTSAGTLFDLKFDVENSELDVRIGNCCEGNDFDMSLPMKYCYNCGRKLGTDTEKANKERLTLLSMTCTGLDLDCELIIGDCEMPASFVWNGNMRFTPYAIKKYQAILCAECRVLEGGNIEILCDNDKLGEEFCYACAGHVNQSEYDKLIIEVEVE